MRSGPKSTMATRSLSQRPGSRLFRDNGVLREAENRTSPPVPRKGNVKYAGQRLPWVILRKPRRQGVEDKPLPKMRGLRTHCGGSWLLWHRLRQRMVLTCSTLTRLPSHLRRVYDDSVLVPESL